MNFIKKLFGFNKMITVIFHMKSGKSQRIPCTNFELMKNGNDITGYKFEGINQMKNDPAFYIHIDSIEFITIER